jgi:hypothetical protein
VIEREVPREGSMDSEVSSVHKTINDNDLIQVKREQDIDVKVEQSIGRDGLIINEGNTGQLYNL